MKEEETMIQEFTAWCKENISVYEGNKRVPVEQFTEQINKAYSKLKMLPHGKTDEFSFMCGVSLGVIMLTNEEK